MVAQEEMVAKLNREKRQWADGRQKNEEELQAAEDRANHLNRVKAKLEQNLDELEDSVEREKKVMIQKFIFQYIHFKYHYTLWVKLLLPLKPFL